MQFDFRVFLGESYDGKSQTADELLARMDALEIDMALVCPFKPLSYDLEKSNSNLADTVGKYDDRLLGAARIDPWQPNAADSLISAVEEWGMKALYINPWEENIQADHKQLDELLAAASEKNLPVSIASGYPWLSEASQVSRLASRWPQVPIVMTNGGQINISGLGQAGAELALNQQDNLFFDTAGIYRQDFIDDMVEELNGERVLFASSAPYFDQSYEIKRIQKAKVSQEYRAKIAGANAQNLFGIEVA
jgi:predicted TIM-barrel fold metal-dependent hydrolase